MSHLIALELSGDEARVAVASGRGDRLVVEQAFSVPLGDDEAGEAGEASEAGQSAEGGKAASQAAAWGAKIAAALAAAGVGRHETLLAVGRENVELRHMVLPPAPDDELPEMVRFQAMREFHQVEDDWLLDYVPLDEDPEGPRNVLAAALAPDLAAQMRLTCEAAGLPLRRLVLRPCASAALFSRSQKTPLEGLSLLIDLFSYDVDLTAMLDGRVIFVRTAKLPGDPLQSGEHRAALLGEVRRTMAAVQNQLGGRAVSCLVLFGDERDHVGLTKALEDQFQTPVQAFDPFAEVPRASKLDLNMPGRSGRFAPLLGLLTTELEGQRHAIDFVNPRRRPEPPSRRWRYIGPAAAAAALLLGYIAYGRLERRWLEAEVEQLSQDLKAATAQATIATKLDARVKEIERWTGEDIVWLDELYRLSSNFPSAKEAMVKQLSLGVSPQGGEIKFEGLAQAEAIARLHEDSRDPGHRVVERDSSKDSSSKYYSWKYSASVLVGPGKKK